MARTVMFAGLLMMAGFVAMIMLNLSHAHSELDSLQAIVELQTRDLKSVNQANAQMATEIRSKLAVLENLTARADQQQALQSKLLQQLQSSSVVQRKTGEGIQVLESRVEELKQKASSEEEEMDGMGEAIMEMKEDLSKVKQQVTFLGDALQKLPGPPVAEQQPDRRPKSTEEPQAKPKELKEMEVELQRSAKVKLGSSELVPSRAPTSEGRNGTHPASSPGLPLSGSASEVSQVLWFRECGCTGIEIEAVTLLRGIVAKMGVERVRTNKCAETCTWSPEILGVLEKISIEEDLLFPSPFRERSPHLTVVVIHAAFLGVCGMNQNMEMVLQGPAGRKGLILVSRSMVEVDRLEEGSAEQCNGHFDAVWVPSAQSKTAFLNSGVSKDRVQVLPEAVDTDLFTCRSEERPEAFVSGLAPLDHWMAHREANSFTFLSMFKWEPRKNWDGLLESFVEAFPEPFTSIHDQEGQLRNVSVRLLIKTQILSWSSDDPNQDIPELFMRLKRRDRTLNGRLFVVDSFLNSSDIPKLYKAVDGFILPSHGEGWGLPLIEAMASGLPSISTGWGGQMDFMTKENSWPVSYNMVESPTMGCRWAEPRRKALVEAMHDVVSGGERVRRKARQGCAEVHKSFHIATVASRAMDLLRSLEAAHLTS